MTTRIGVPFCAVASCTLIRSRPSATAMSAAVAGIGESPKTRHTFPSGAISRTV